METEKQELPKIAKTSKKITKEVKPRPEKKKRVQFKPISNFAEFFVQQKSERMKIVKKLEKKIKLDEGQLKKAIQALLKYHEK